MYIQDLIKKNHPSRITLTYRTSIDGQPADLELPLRLLILGDFSGRGIVAGGYTAPPENATTIEQRELMKLDGSPGNLAQAMSSMKVAPSFLVPDRILTPPRPIVVKCTSTGKLGEAKFSCKVGSDDKDKKDVVFQTKLMFPTPTPAPKPAATVPDQAKGPFWFEVVDWPREKASTNVTTRVVLEDRKGIFRTGDTFSISPTGDVTPGATNLGGGQISVESVSSTDSITVKLPLGAPDVFTPDAIAELVPEIAGLQRVRRLLSAMQSDLDNNRELRDTLNYILAKDDLRNSLTNTDFGDDKKSPWGLFGKKDTPNLALLPKIDLSTTDSQFDKATDPVAPALTVSSSVRPIDLLTRAARLDPVTESRITSLSKDLREVQPSPFADLDEGQTLFAARVAALVLNVYFPTGNGYNKARLVEALHFIDSLVDVQMQEILKHPAYKALAATWGAVENLFENIDWSPMVKVDLLDVSKEELRKDFTDNQTDLFSGALFKRVYIDEYDQYGGVPFSTMIGLYEFENTPGDVRWLRNMAKIANASHAPFVSAAAPGFFGHRFQSSDKPGTTVDDVAALKDITGLLNQPQYGNWSDFRDQPEAAYVGLTFPRFLLRGPWDADDNPTDTLPTFTEERTGSDGDYLWGNSAVLVARNLVRAFNETGWCQNIRGPKGGGIVTALPAAFYQQDDKKTLKPPVEIVIPDYRELEFATNGFIPLVWKKDSTTACFFSVQSAKRAAKFKDPNDNQNAELVCNLAYTFSITRIAHYVKSIMRDNIGSTADDKYIQRVLAGWLGDYVTQVVNPDDITIARYPFKAAQVTVVPKVGEIGQYDCQIKILPHLQFEGLDVELSLESRLGAA